jgi:ABC-type molybdenum transport system ATPase subunit/photorepair protein PhrA
LVHDVGRRKHVDSKLLRRRDEVAAIEGRDSICPSIHRGFQKRPHPNPNFDQRIKFDRLVLRENDRANVCSSVDEAMRLVLVKRQGRVQVRGGNGSGKSTLLAVLKGEIKNRAISITAPQPWTELACRRTDNQLR